MNTLLNEYLDLVCALVLFGLKKPSSLTPSFTLRFFFSVVRSPKFIFGPNVAFSTKLGVNNPHEKVEINNKTAEMDDLLENKCVLDVLFVSNCEFFFCFSKSLKRHPNSLISE